MQNESLNSQAGGPCRGRVLVTPRSFTRAGHPALDRLVAEGYELVMASPGCQPTQDELLGLLPGCVGYIAGVEPVGGDLLRAAPGLRAISRNGTGTDNIDLAAASALGIQVLRAAGTNARSVAELAWGLVLALARSIPASDAALKRGVWQRHSGIELEGRRLGIAGCGTVGRLVARFGLAFGMEVSAFDPFPDERFSAGEGFRFDPSLDSVIATSDVLSLHCPPSADGPLITGTRLASMPDGALLVNTARAELIDDGDLLRALESGRLGGYATDVFRTEPPGDEALFRHPKVVLSPHVGGYTMESIDRVVEVTVDQLLGALRGSRPS
jgi:D-3-phosphoglycerate dehydrogenase